jgi:hypothetical protein
MPTWRTAAPYFTHRGKTLPQLPLRHIEAMARIHAEDAAGFRQKGLPEFARKIAGLATPYLAEIERRKQMSAEGWDDPDHPHT